DHCLVHLLPTYKQKLKSAKPVVRTVERWTSETELVLQACFDCADWSVFEAAANDLDELTDTVTSYISFCEDMCVPTRTYLTYNNDKPWFTAKIKQLRQAKEDGYRSGDKTAQMTQFYSAVIESVLCTSITVWFGSACKSDIRRLQRTVRTAEKIIGMHLPNLQDLYNARVKKRAGKIITDPSHPCHNLFAFLPSGRR
ncbi:hypothetical protein PO909_002557, partial [Leuciscus waleckii]